MRELIEFIAKSLVGEPDAIELNESATDAGKLFKLKVAPADLGRIIGRDGRTASAFRTVVYHAAQKAGERVVLEFVGNEARSAEQSRAAE